jgi:hypothetical protein
LKGRVVRFAAPHDFYLSWPGEVVAKVAWFDNTNFKNFKHDLDYEDLFDWATAYIADNAIDLKTIKSDFG